MTAPKAYLDNNVVCGITKDDLPVGEPEALTDLLRLHSERKISVVTSEITRREMETWRGKNRPAAERVFYLLEKVEFIQDHTVHGFANQEGPMGTVCSYPIVSDDPASRELRDIGLDRTDAHHVMLAVHNGCDYFITCDTKSILKYRPDVEAKYPKIKLRKPSELVAELAAMTIR